MYLSTVRSESLCAFRLWYVGLVVSIEVAAEVYCCFTEFDVHGSVHLGNICSIKSPTRCTYYVFFIPLYFLALHVSGAIAPILRSSNCSLQP
jgi:hypothetical protein